MKTGDKVKILDIHPDDGFYQWREEFIGSCGVLSEDLIEQPEGWWSAGLEDSNWAGSPEIYFYKVKLKEIQKCDLLTFQFPKPSISLPTHPVLLSEAKRRGFFLADTPYNKLFYKLFFHGGQVVFKEDVDKDFLEKAFPYLLAFMRTFACPHEEKDAVCAMLLSELVEPELEEGERGTLEQ